MSTRTVAAAAGTGGGSTGSSSTGAGGGGGRGFTGMMASLNPFSSKSKGRSGSGSTFSGRQGRGAGGSGGVNNAETVPRSYGLNGAGQSRSERLAVPDEQAPVPARRCVFITHTIDNIV